ncbi:MAG: DUF969 domain-containing protein [Erysipelotrichaceae bacterium]
MTLIGIVVVIVGFALKLNAILIVLIAGIITGLVGGLTPVQILETFGSAFVSNRSMGIFIIIMLVTGTLERNGLQQVAANLIGKIKGATSALVIAAYGVFRVILAAFNVSLGGVAGFVRPVVMPMVEGAVGQEEIKEEHLDDLKGMSSAMENIAWFFGQVLFVGGSGALLVQGTMADLGYEVSLLEMAKIEIPVAILAVVLASLYFMWRDKALKQKYYGKGGVKK